MYIVIGGTGFLGSYIVSELKRQTKEDIVSVSRMDQRDNIKHIKCDVSNKADLDGLISFINSAREPCKIIYLSACANPERIAADPWMSWNTNVTGLDYLISRISRNVVFIFASSEAVYGDSQAGYHYAETDRLSPVSMYGVQKMAGEAVVTHYGGHTFRYALLTGPSLTAGRKHFQDVIMDNVRSGIPIELFSDTFRSMLDFGTAAYLTVRLLKEHSDSLPQTVNISGDEGLSKYDVGLRLVQKYKLPESLIIPIKMGDDDRIFKVRRALSILMDNTVLKTMLSLERVLINL